MELKRELVSTDCHFDSKEEKLTVNAYMGTRKGKMDIETMIQLFQIDCCKRVYFDIRCFLVSALNECSFLEVFI